MIEDEGTGQETQQQDALPQNQGDFKKRFSEMSASEQGMAMMLVTVALATDSSDVSGTLRSAISQIGNLLGFNDFGSFIDWQSEARQSGLPRSQISAQIDYKNFDFQESENAILDLIAEHESGGDYNIVYGGSQIDLTDMTINEVLDWQKDFVNGGSPSSAAGRYQIIQGTLSGLKDEMNLTGEEKFDEQMQDRMGTVLLERRGYSSFLEGRISEDQFMRNLSQEWAALPKDHGGASYYAGDGLNKALVTPQAVLAALHQVREQHELEQEQSAHQTAQNNHDDPAAGEKGRVPDLDTAFNSHASGEVPAPDEQVASTPAATVNVSAAPIPS